MTTRPIKAWDGSTWIDLGVLAPNMSGYATSSHKATHAVGGSDALAPSDIGAATSASPTFTGILTAPIIAGTDTTDSSSSTTGALKIAGGAGIAKGLYVGAGLTVSTGVLTASGTSRLYHGSTTYTEFANANEINTFGSGGAATTMFLQYRSGDLNVGGSNLIVSKKTSGTGVSITSAANVGVGTLSPSTKLHVSNGVTTSDNGFAITGVAAPTAPTVALVSSAGNVDNGTHYYYVTYVTAMGETSLSPNALVTVADKTVAGQVDVTIPVSTDSRVTSRKIYRTTAGSLYYDQVKLLATVSDNTTTTYRDNIADASTSWPAAGSGTSYFSRDNTATPILKDGTASVIHVSGQNTAVGRLALDNVVSNTGVGGYNTAVGVQALRGITTGQQNTAVGHGTLTATTTGEDNIAVGISAGYANTTGGANTYIGRNTGGSNATGSFNTLVGYYAGFGGGVANNPTAIVGIGSQALAAVTTGDYSTGVGYYALGANTSGKRNTGLGLNAGRAFTTGSYNLALGAGAGYTGTTATISGSVTIGTDSAGTGATATADNQFVLGTANHSVIVPGTTDSSSSTTGAVQIAGGLGVAKKLYVGTDASVGGNLTVTGNLTINGTTTTVNSTTVTVDDPIITLGGDTAPTSDDNKDRGVEFRYHDGTSAKLGFFGYDDSAQNFVFLTSATNTSEVFTGTKATIDAYLSGSNINAGTVAEARIDSAIARLASPTFTGTPAAPTASTGTSTTQIATTAFVAGVQSLGGLKTIDTDTSTHTLNIGSGTTSSGQTKTINIGTGGAAGSDTKINIGPSTYGHYTRIEIGSSQTNGASYVILGNSNSTNSYVLLQNGRIDCLPVGVNEGATFKIPHGETPDSGSIENGDIWTTTTGMFVRINGTSKQLAAVTDSNDIEITTSNGGVVLKSSNGTRYKITVANDGSLTTTAI